MDTHNIRHSIISLANPWLDFLPAHEARSVAAHMNDDMQALCASPAAQQRLVLEFVSLEFDVYE